MAMRKNKIGEKSQVATVNGIPVDELVGRISAQVLYDLREKHEFCSGTDLAEFFTAECDEPSPSGRKMISGKNAHDFVLGCIVALAWNSGS